MKRNILYLALISCLFLVSCANKKDNTITDNTVSTVKETPKTNKTKETDEASANVNSGDLFDSIKTLDNNAYDLIKTDESYSLNLEYSKPAAFFASCEKIYKNAFRENESIVFAMYSKKELIATLTVIKNDSGENYPIHSSLTIFANSLKQQLETAYYKNKYWKHLDLENQSSKSLKQIKENYTSKTYSKILSDDKFKYPIAEALASIGVTSLSSMDIVSHKTYDEDISYDVSIDTDKYPLTVTVSYLQLVDDYTVISIENANNHHVYYLPNGATQYEDMYDYKTDKLKSKKRK